MRSFLPCALLYALAALVRIAYAAAVTFPPLDDPAYYLKVAENLAEGKGLYIEAIWSYLYPFESVAHPSNEYWMPLTSMIYSPLFVLFGSSFKAAQWMGALAGAAIVPMTYYIAIRYLPRNRGAIALTAGTLTALSPLLSYQAVSADSALPFSLLAFTSILLLSDGPRAGRPKLFLGGILAGLCYLARNDGIILIGSVVGYYLFASHPHKVQSIIFFMAGALPLAAVWHLRQYLTFGTPFPVSSIWAIAAVDYSQLFSYSAGGPLDLLKGADTRTLIALRLKALAHNFGVLTFALLPWGILSIFGSIMLWKLKKFKVATVYSIIFFSGTALIFSVPTLHGTYYHSIGGSLPFLAIFGLHAIDTALAWTREKLSLRADPLPVLLIALLLVTAFQLAISWPVLAKQHKAWEDKYTRLSSWLGENRAKVVMADQAHTLHYVTDLPTISLPASDLPEVAAEVARRYGARYLVITESFGIYPEALRESGDNNFTLVHRGPGFEVYELVGSE